MQLNVILVEIGWLNIEIITVVNDLSIRVFRRY